MLILRPPPPSRSTLFPYTTLFRSKLDSFRGESQFRTWLLSITWRKAIDRRKSVSRWLRMASSPPRDDAGEDAFDAMERRSEEHTSELQSLAYLVCRLLLEKKKSNS